MTEQESQSGRKTRKIMLIILVVVVPTLIIFSALIGLEIISINAVTSIDVLKTMELKCYNVNWFGTEGTGFQVVYRDTAEEVKAKLKSFGKIIDESFFEEQDVVKYLVNVCPHINNRDQIPENYDQTIGVPALDKCIERKKAPELCIELIS